MDIDALLQMIRDLSAMPVLAILVIMLGTLISEDATIVGVAVLASQQAIDLPLGYGAVVAGIITGDLLLYWLGYLAAKVRHFRARVATPQVFRAKRWVKGRLAPILLATRFLPGSRVPIYTACGFFRLSLPIFTITLLLAGLVWVALVFALINTFGAMVFEALGPWKWAGAAAFILLAFILPHFFGARVARYMGLTPDPKPPRPDEGAAS